MEVLKLAERGHYQISTSTSIGLGQYNESIEYYDKVLAIDPNYVLALVNIGIALNLGQYEEAIRYFDKVLAIDPNNVFALDNKRLAIDNLG